MAIPDYQSLMLPVLREYVTALASQLGSVPKYLNGARAIAALSEGRTWATRDPLGGIFGADWGIAQTIPIVSFRRSRP